MRLDALLAERIWRVALATLCVLLLVFLVAPLLVIVPFSFNAEPYFSYPIPGFSIRWYQELFRSAAWGASFRNSLVVALPTTVLATTLGTLAAVGLTLGNFPLKALVVGLFLSPMMIPHIIIGLGLYFFYVHLRIVHSFAGLILAHTTLAVPFVVLTVAATLANFNTNLTRAAASLGAPPFTVYRKIVLPLILPGILSGALFAFVVSFDELIVALLLSGPEQRTLPRQIWSGARESISPVIMTVATLLIAIATLLMLLMEGIRRRGERLGGDRRPA
jgi:putative spermidine/putrescine transport system permease protein